MKTRTDLLNFLAEKYSLQRYLEIGVQVPELNFDKIKCKYKVSVDPDPSARATFCMTSDVFFSDDVPNCIVDDDGFMLQEYDLIFIDGLHTAEQVQKDFENALKVISPNGFIILHDCNPLKEEHTIVPRPTNTGHWNGDVYRFAAAMPKYPFWTVDIDNGCMVVKPEKDYFHDGIHWNQYMTWGFFNANRKELLNLITWDEFVNSHSHV